MEHPPQVGSGSRQMSMHGPRANAQELCDGPLVEVLPVAEVHHCTLPRTQLPEGSNYIDIG